MTNEALTDRIMRAAGPFLGGSLDGVLQALFAGVKMNVIITGIRTKTDEYSHEEITHYQWVTSGEFPRSSITAKSKMVSKIRSGARAYVVAGGTKMHVKIVDGREPYLQTVADGKICNNLLSLPRIM